MKTSNGLAILIVVVVIILVIIAGTLNSKKETIVSNYYDNSKSFCEHYNLTVDMDIYLLSYNSRCINVTNDKIQFVYIQKLNDRWFFREGEGTR